MKILILRTIAHNRIWEGSQPSCFYDTLSYDIIKSWEPVLINNSLNDVKSAIGIYTRQYFTYPGAYSNTVNEHKPSLLKLDPVSAGSLYFSEDNGSEIRIHFTFIAKAESFNMNEMNTFDTNLVRAKLDEMNRRSSPTRYPSLCFTLDKNIVRNILASMGKTDIQI